MTLILTKDEKKERRKEQCRVSKRKWYAGNKEIAKERVKEWQGRDPVKHKLRQQKYRNSHPDKLWIGMVKQRAKEKGIPFTISEDDIVIPRYCPILGIPLFRIGKIATANSPSIDKIVPELGYIPGNVQVVSKRCNTIKNDATLEELIMLGEWAKLELLEREDKLYA